MKTIEKLLIALALTLWINVNTFAQDQAATDDGPVFVTMTTMHWNPDPETDFSDWLKTEKEYFEKVTSKNDLILDSGLYTHYFTPDNSELMRVNVYRSWDDIEKAQEENNRLLKEAWPDEKARQAFLKKQGSYYSPQHSDEIYVSLPYYMPASKSDKPMIYYMKKSDLSMNPEGNPENFKEYYDKVTSKNSKLKGYYTMRHRWGSNSRDLVEVFVFDKLGDIEDAFAEEGELMAQAWPDEAKREAFDKELGKLFTGKHADYIYRSIPELQKN
ncbi:hypothetical protein C7S20_02715 [Christiangramia fulva]|uniref:Antibiotic biosynthesis monooxygenase n=1 Tax=Christiangramia fulva TaxID=2126553 RepID=A0A2R3Z1Y9_9FLAO|nr:hypothetical protein [Christiangramia fulva]AVR44259.1 hypothetical protein C7S20_02715 [Christiangramia fulva]